jgi:hypothetical protein
MADNN